jgi:hypothetical protein
MAMSLPVATQVHGRQTFTAAMPARQRECQRKVLDVWLWGNMFGKRGARWISLISFLLSPYLVCIFFIFIGSLFIFATLS